MPIRPREELTAVRVYVYVYGAAHAECELARASKHSRSVHGAHEGASERAETLYRHRRRDAQRKRERERGGDGKLLERVLIDVGSVGGERGGDGGQRKRERMTMLMLMMMVVLL